MFGSFAHLSSRLVRTRDAIIAGIVGVGVSTLVLLVGAGDRVSRLSDYFVEVGPTLAHGRNIVNVILVDFRGFDTLGEITVLVVAAIGVHALLRISADERGRS
jgi:multicomponent Na+:H+ antiporter subunit A